MNSETSKPRQIDLPEQRAPRPAAARAPSARLSRRGHCAAPSARAGVSGLADRADVPAQLEHDVGELLGVGELERRAGAAARSRAGPRSGPGLLLITYTVSARNTDSRRSCVTRMTLKRCSVQQVAQDAPQLLAREGVERAERLVEQQHLRLVDQRAADARRAAACRPRAATGTCPRSRPGRPSAAACARAPRTRRACA